MIDFFKKFFGSKKKKKKIIDELRKASLYSGIVMALIQLF